METPDSPNPLGKLNISVSDVPIYDAYIAARLSCALVVATHINLFEFLHLNPSTQSEISSQFEFSERGTHSLLLALRYCKCVQLNSNDQWELTENSELYLLKSSPQYLGGLFQLEWDGFITPKSYYASLKVNKPQIYAGKDPWESHDADPDKAKQFTLAMHSISSRPALGLAESIDLMPYSHVLDVGGGSGVFLIALLHKFPHLYGTVFEIPSVVPIANELFKKAHINKRARGVVGNFFKDDFQSFGQVVENSVPKAKSFDVILLSQILHDWNYEQGKALLKKAFESLPPHGLIIIHEKLMNDQKTGPLANILVNIDMVVWTEGQQYSYSELSQMLLEQGFENINLVETVGYWSAVLAIKPGK